ncbi:polyphosphate polymerase domain-containing protein [bacterium]|nr:polyphosphate polymerase domain-containing protein [bacterium]
MIEHKQPGNRVTFQQDRREPAVEEEIAYLLRRFETCALSQINNAALMRRMDTKFVFPVGRLPELMPDLQRDYEVLEVNGVRMQHYQTVYYDTPDFQLYHQHHNGERNRFKLRIRSYLDSEVNFLEVKRKDNHDRTYKTRMETDSKTLDHSPRVETFLWSNFPLEERTLVRKITNRFYRITLLSKHDQERMTLDLDLRFMSPSGEFSLPGVVIAEVKQPRFSAHSTFMMAMRRTGCRPTRFSKYCVGVALAYPQVKRNAFKPLLRQIDKLVLGGSY